MPYFICQDEGGASDSTSTSESNDNEDSGVDRQRIYKDSYGDLNEDATQFGETEVGNDEPFNSGGYGLSLGAQEYIDQIGRKYEVDTVETNKAEVFKPREYRLNANYFLDNYIGAKDEPIYSFFPDKYTIPLPGGGIDINIGTKDPGLGLHLGYSYGLSDVSTRAKDFTVVGTAKVFYNAENPDKSSITFDVGVRYKGFGPKLNVGGTFGEFKDYLHYMYNGALRSFSYPSNDHSLPW